MQRGKGQPRLFVSRLLQIVLFLLIPRVWDCVVHRIPIWYISSCTLYFSSPNSTDVLLCLLWAVPCPVTLILAHSADISQLRLHLHPVPSCSTSCDWWCTRGSSLHPTILIGVGRHFVYPAPHSINIHQFRGICKLPTTPHWARLVP